MANIKSAKKRINITQRKTDANRNVKSRMRTSIKKFGKAVEEQAADVEDLYRNAISMVDKAASKGVIHKNAANRKKAQLAKLHSA